MTNRDPCQDHPHMSNPRRRHSALDYLSPMAYEKRELVRP
jgi:transposase InsO family protein